MAGRTRVQIATQEQVVAAGRTPRPDCLVRGDCLEIMRLLPSGKIGMVFCDLPYGLMSCQWDSELPLGKLWPEYRRVCKPGAAMVFTACQLFTTGLILSNREEFRYCWYWVKDNKTNPFNANRRPMNNVEEVVVFCSEPPPYYPVGLTKKPKWKTRFEKDVRKGDGPYGSQKSGFRRKYTNYPCQTLYFSRDPVKLHPTQKPVALVEYMIRTYTNPGDVVLDNTCGSGTTAIAALKSGRRFVCIERDPEIFEVAKRRIEAAEKNPGFGL